MNDKQHSDIDIVNHCAYDFPTDELLVLCKVNSIWLNNIQNRSRKEKYSDD